MKLLALADDVTGALEVGALLGAPVFLDVEARDNALPACPCVIDTESRHLSPAEAAEKILHCTRGWKPDLIYKKTDSTLRGNIGAELAALAGAYPERQVIFLPAYPAMGRTVLNGELLVHGVPLHLSDFAADPLNPVRESRISALFQPDDRVSINHASCDEDLEQEVNAALQLRPFPILSGPASVPRHIARCLGLKPSLGDEVRLSPRCIIVNGSLHPIAKEQVRRIRRGGGWVVVDLESSSGSRTQTAADFAGRLGRAVREKLEQEPFETLILIGGDSAFAVLKALNVRVIQPIGEVALGVPVSQVGTWQLVTKAGGFGDVDLLARLQWNAQRSEQ
jgi:D-threonate/D-erythronate kinase